MRAEPVLPAPSTMLVTGSLVIGSTGGVVVDAGPTSGQGDAIADRVTATGLPLQSILITDEHPDHDLGNASLRARWPDTPALPEAVAGTAATGQAALAGWRPNWGDRLPVSPTVPQALRAYPDRLAASTSTTVIAGQASPGSSTGVYIRPTTRDDVDVFDLGLADGVEADAFMARPSTPCLNLALPPTLQLSAQAASGSRY